MNELNKLFDEILSEKTAPGELFETKLVTNEKGVTFTEYANFPDSIRNFFDFGLLHAEKDWLVYEDERYTYQDAFKKGAQVANALLASGIKKEIVLRYVCRIILNLYFVTWELLEWEQFVSH